MPNIAESRDPQAVREMFDGIAPRYDFANHLLSGGIDLWWRRCAVKFVGEWRPGRILDLATGSGDLALALKRTLPEAAVTGADFSPEMLAIARRKGLQHTVVADALHLPFADGDFDCVTVAFGLRNMVDWSAALREMRRVLDRAGHILILDFSIPQGALQSVYRFYLHRCLPTLAAMVTGRGDAYEYLGATIEKFPSGSAMTSLLEASGFVSAKARPLTGGIATIYSANCGGSL